MRRLRRSVTGASESGSGTEPQIFGRSAQDGLRLHDTRDRSAVRVDDLRVHRDHVAADAERAADRLDVALAHRAEEARARLDRRGAGRSLGQVEERADARRAVGERPSAHRRASGRRPCRAPRARRAGAHFLAARVADRLDTEQAGQRHRDLPVHPREILTHRHRHHDPLQRRAAARARPARAPHRGGGLRERLVGGVDGLRRLHAARRRGGAQRAAPPRHRDRERLTRAAPRCSRRRRRRSRI